MDNDGNTIDLTMDEGDFASLESVASELNRQLALSGNFEGERALNVRVVDGYTAANVTVPTDAIVILLWKTNLKRPLSYGNRFLLWFQSTRSRVLTRS